MTIFGEKKRKVEILNLLYNNVIIENISKYIIVTYYSNILLFLFTLLCNIILLHDYAIM